MRNSLSVFIAELFASRFHKSPFLVSGSDRCTTTFLIQSCNVKNFAFCTIELERHGGHYFQIPQLIGTVAAYYNLILLRNLLAAVNVLSARRIALISLLIVFYIKDASNLILVGRSREQNSCQVKIFSLVVTLLCG